MFILNLGELIVSSAKSKGTNPRVIANVLAPHFGGN